MFWESLGGSALISGLGSLATGLVNTFTGQKQSKDLMDYQYKLQQKGIEDQRAYNSPEQQMSRLAAAGLSPNLVYGNGVDGNQSSAASPGLAQRRGEFENPLQDAVQQYNMAKQLQMQEIRTRNEAFESRERIHKMRAETLGQMLDNAFNDKTMETRIKQESQKLANDIQRQSNMEAEEAFSWSRTRNEDNKLAQIWAETDLLKERKGLTSQQALTEIVRRGALRAGIKLTEKQVEQVASVIAFNNAGTNLREQEYDIKELDFLSDKELQEWLAEHPGVQLADQIVDHIADKINRALGGNARSGGRRKRSRRRGRR